MNNFSKEELKEHLINLGVKNGDNLCIHSKAISFGKLDFHLSDFINIIKDIIGHKGMMAFPAFTFNLKQNDIFDVHKTTPYNMGVISDYAFKIKNFTRNNNPIYSYLLFGKENSLVENLSYKICFGKGSIFELFKDKNFKLLLLGCNYQEGATFIHNIEYEMKASYRKKIFLKRKIIYNDEIKNIEIEFFARINSKIKTNLHNFEKIIKENNIGNFERIKISNRFSHLISLKDLENFSFEIFKKNINIFIDK